MAERFLDDIGEGRIDEIWLIGSRAGVSNDAYPERTGVRDDSDWDYLVVGEDFDAVEDEKIARLEDGERIYGLALDVEVSKRSKHKDIIFSSSAPISGKLLFRSPCVGKDHSLGEGGYFPAVAVFDEAVGIVAPSLRFPSAMHPTAMTLEQMNVFVGQSRMNMPETGYLPGGQGDLFPFVKAAFLTDDGRVHEGIAHAVVFEQRGDSSFFANGHTYCESNILADGFTVGGFWAHRPETLCADGFLKGAHASWAEPWKIAKSQVESRIGASRAECLELHGRVSVASSLNKSRLSLGD